MISQKLIKQKNLSYQKLLMLIKSVCYNYKIGLNKTKIIKANHNIEKMRNNLKARVQRANQNNMSKLSDTFDNPNSPTYEHSPDRVSKFVKSRKECDTEIDDYLKLLTDYKFEMDDLKKGKAKQALKAFENHYDKYMNQILKDVRDILQSQKKKLMQQIMSDRERELANEKQIKRRIDEQIAELRDMKRGLGTETYKQYIAKVVVYDFGYQTKKIKQSMSRLSYDNVHLRIDQKKKDCYRNDMQRIIICEEYDYIKDDPGYDNLHPNRDIIKKSMWD